ncbi:MAG: peptidylprolyl isomerase [Acidimicrobiales bacterium]
MGTDKRARQKANRASKQEASQRVATRRQWRRYAITGVIAAVALAAVLFVLSLGGDDDGDDTATDAGSATETTTGNDAGTGDADSATTDPTLTEAAVEPPGPGAAIEGTPDCPAEDGSSERTTSFTEPPPLCIDPTASYTAEMVTTEGTIVAELYPDRAPETVNNFVFLARYHYYDGAPFHRIIPGFVIQGGDPIGEPLGVGGPGYQIAEETPENGEYQIGSLVMAKERGPDTTGGQFFFVTGPAGESLPPEYSLFGQIVEGDDVASAIEQIPTNTEDYPLEEIYIESVTITQS